MRTAIEQEVRTNLPLISDISRYESTPVQLVALTDEVRKKCEGLDELRIRREVRDAMDSARLKIGAQGRSGMSGVQDHIRRATARKLDHA